MSTEEDIPVIIDGKPYPNITKNPLHVICSTAYVLGIFLGLGCGLFNYVNFKNFNVYIIAMAVFHYLEYYITALYNPGKVNSESFLINNGKTYAFAHIFATSEYAIEFYLYREWKSTRYNGFHMLVVAFGIILILFGQYVRSKAMITAGQSFSHEVKTTRNSDHKLVKSGLYSWSRHPSYLGYFWWALGTQALLLNPVSFVLYIFLLWRFFSKRIQFEEHYLMRFFGAEYASYKKAVGVGIPFIK
ncbi:protein-S-isoprenylcysteine carboxyl O-methyltransferase Ecym_5461 [Eremothecium cymbalariae DBVPG|uniref:Protein-S-isoprenylcysteine O-methyltransferase n=1 Tax=Eremothecium cymbalariae (strain CBS 270.75 / DBVPG 7215 / KCTC 17166 / NRRL Y-17582) TaxID=931890 RepID=I6NDR8_ERECY|nr:hypothetical protein Ecym_5461 [Eremothecium cymbalariae DBVPG\